MSVLQVSAYCGPNGGNYISSMMMLEHTLKDKGIETIYAFCETVRNYSWCKEIEKNAKVYYLPVAKARIKTETYRILRKIFQENEIEIVHTHFELYDIPVSLTSPKGTKMFWHLHDPIGDTKTLHWSRKLLMKIQYSILSKHVTLISCSEKHGDYAVMLGFPKEHFKYIPNGLNVDRIHNTAGTKKDLEFLMFCWDFIRKGGDLALNAADRLYKDGFEFSVRFIPNSIPESRPYLVQQAPVSDVNSLFEHTGAFLHLSRSEGLSYALLEAISAGLPVICSDIPENLPVRDCPTVRFVTNENVDEIYHEMKSLIESDFAINKDEAEQSRQLIADKYSLKTWCTKIVELYLK
ncbi:MAG: glycosyltransferase family 4 protein [Acutalibacteraceae bacterium]